MKIHAEINNAEFRFIVVQCAGTNGGRKFGNFVNLRTVKLPAEVAYMNARQKGIEVIESWEVDSRNQGPKSSYGQTLKAMITRLAGHAYPKAKAA